ncbi:glyoxalase [Anabaena cylindrica FACHB-243]|uniref:Glyoxalase/bleomycin resistance protein/dioxygenase n=1 Tax=Anabaena cylindrica (strain ATCC 27899 / PCC 7122) TaxID=272123 RepID=K9ZQ27_ANACC|nr:MULTISPECIES: VOC family protein [Anabaena]AFZ60904.1 Glyoxalase/bleomycin resistance protein/dioxygenase [Anabaena cylindrica PCC 7122]MBD2420476.1 glyoxalase [Anabaena cylindrica FACHB-243]MBY5282404.1 glyoxalase [Anabaena sp. CCAP 1446/1C]MBY5306330.1 glyoxalase [Anabaena sp. CCAP 1446/1C]MCM2406898.1 glyoxalase [Anabaena sp. CCAP 1446/1C]
MQKTLFHLAFPVTDITKTKAYYVDALGCISGRENPHALILNLYGHQLVAHVTQELTPQRGIYPRHFGLIFTDKQDWQQLLDRAQIKQLTFREEAKNRFVGSPLEHNTFFLEDPFYNLMEFKYYRYPEAIFGSSEHILIGET